MDAMVLHRIGGPLVRETRPDPVPGPGEVRIRVEACAVCRTDLHVIDGDLPDLRLPIVPGHEIVGRVEAAGAGTAGPAIGARVGLPWLGHTCGHCAYCAAGRENLCEAAGFTGYTRDGGSPPTSWPRPPTPSRWATASTRSRRRRSSAPG